MAFRAVIVVFLIVLGGSCDSQTKGGKVNDCPNSRTVLFKEFDANKECWTADDLVLLNARKYMQDLIPKAVPDNLTLLLKYFKWCIMSVRGLDIPGDVQMLILMALADTIGGYLQHIVIPVTHEAYYAGNANFQLTQQLHALLDALKETLGTDGGGWSAPISSSLVSTKVYPLWLNLSHFDDACKLLIVDCKHTCDSKPPKIMIPMPFFDDNDRPNAIAMPFRCRSLFNLMSQYSSDILLRYYSLSMRCLMVTRSRGNVLAFNHRFHNWILTQVVPHLEDCHWYPGFWGVMRIIERMRIMGLEPSKRFDDGLCGPTCINNDVVNRQQHNDTRITDEESTSMSGRILSMMSWKYVLLCITGSLFMCCCSLCALCCLKAKPATGGGVQSCRTSRRSFCDGGFGGTGVRSQGGMTAGESRSSLRTNRNEGRCRVNTKKGRTRRSVTRRPPASCEYSTVTSFDECSTPRMQKISPLARLIRTKLIGDSCGDSDLSSSSCCPPPSSMFGNGQRGGTDCGVEDAEDEIEMDGDDDVTDC